MSRSRRAGWVLAGLALLAALPANAQTESYPNRKITFLVGFAPGGGIDTFARVVAQALTDQLGYQIVVENRAGAASNIAAKLVAEAAPDGYALLFTGNSYAINQTFYKNPGYATDDIAPVAFAALDSQAFAVNADNPARSLKDFLAAAKTKPFTFGFGGTSARIAAEYLFHALAKANGQGVPFQSGAPALSALLGHHVDINVGPVAETHPMVLQGAVRALAVTGPRRADALPDVPTLEELGFSGIAINGFIALLAPAKTPVEIRAKLNAAVNRVIAMPSVEQRLRALGYEPYRGALADAPAYLKTQIDTWGNLIRATGIATE
ncbi:MAG TPA: tripartite tricarboxylate transporter substrate binding protein [Xanthobacteraceae bacterium]|nr:tripartite tricarboxylate transporter substrate binding protein [Xanthobacteraceae bacterium]